MPPRRAATAVPLRNQTGTKFFCRKFPSPAWVVKPLRYRGTLQVVEAGDRREKPSEILLPKHIPIPLKRSGVSRVASESSLHRAEIGPDPSIVQRSPLLCPQFPPCFVRTSPSVLSPSPFCGPAGQPSNWPALGDFVGKDAAGNAGLFSRRRSLRHRSRLSEIPGAKPTEAVAESLCFGNGICRRPSKQQPKVEAGSMAGTFESRGVLTGSEHG